MLIRIIFGFCAFLWLSCAVCAQTLETADFRLRLDKASQTVAALEPKNTPGFDFTPADRLDQRAADRFHHLGDLILRVRIGNSGPWQRYDTAETRKPVEPLNAAGPTIAAANLSPTLPSDIPLQITRSLGTYAPRGNFVNERDAFTIPLGRSTTVIELAVDTKSTKMD